MSSTYIVRNCHPGQDSQTNNAISKRKENGQRDQLLSTRELLTSRPFLLLEERVVNMKSGSVNAEGPKGKEKRNVELPWL